MNKFNPNSANIGKFPTEKGTTIGPMVVYDNVVESMISKEYSNALYRPIENFLNTNENRDYLEEKKLYENQKLVLDSMKSNMIIPRNMKSNRKQNSLYHMEKDVLKHEYIEMVKNGIDIADILGSIFILI